MSAADLLVTGGTVLTVDERGRVVVADVPGAADVRHTVVDGQVLLRDRETVGEESL